MVTDRPGKSWAQPLIVMLAIVVPTLVPGAGQAADAFSWLASGMAQAVSQFALLAVIIGASGRLRDYGIALPGARDTMRAGLLFVVLVAISAGLKTILSLTGTGTDNAAAFPVAADGVSMPLLFILSAAFALAVACREELFYRVYLIETLKEHGAGKAAAVMVSTGLFALGHTWQGVPGILSSTLAGSVLALAALQGFRFSSLVLAHAAYNFGVIASAFGLFDAAK